MDSFILNLGLRWLAAVDAFSASCVSQEWRCFLAADRDNGDFWKQICLNSGPSNIPNLVNSNDYRRLAMGLRLRDNKEPPAPQEQSYTPTTRPEDYFAVVDIYKRHDEENGKRRKEIITSFVCPIEDTEFVQRNEQLELTFQGENPYSANMNNSAEACTWRQEAFRNTNFWFASSPLAYAARAVSKETQNSQRHQMDVTLFRRDNAKSVCLLRGARLADDFDYDDEQVFTFTGFVDLVLAGDDTGMIARGLIDESTSISVECFMTFSLMLPPPGSVDQPQWLTNCRQASQDRRAYVSSASDMDALSKTSHFAFGFEKVCIRFYTSNDWDIDQLKGQNELIIALEGLCWE